MALKRRLAWLHWGFLLAELRKEAVDFALTDLPTTGIPYMRKLLAIKIQYNSYMYFPRLPPRPVRPGPVPELGTRVEAKFDIRFCHFFGGFGFKPRVVQKVKKCSFFFFLVFLRE